ncbi:hypothetical protein BJ508DRAFT_87386 [Ascobolus immersus RN42]|uniref:Uncharacterized protein n=1 Tax=Ascobolus immersus RN42 TaxID=1160509 RepID=A0A3N4I9B3_ASCIM|nr:hypothetical protein BJ508DRAFT_87386 [Ascobolus immersus RN42]
MCFKRMRQIQTFLAGSNGRSASYSTELCSYFTCRQNKSKNAFSLRALTTSRDWIGESDAGSI